MTRDPLALLLQHPLFESACMVHFMLGSAAAPDQAHDLLLLQLTACADPGVASKSLEIYIGPFVFNCLRSICAGLA